MIINKNKTIQESGVLEESWSFQGVLQTKMGLMDGVRESR